VRCVRAVAASSILLALNSCGDDVRGQQDVTVEEARRILYSDLRNWDQAAGPLWQEETLEQILPNTRAWVDDGRDTPRRLSDLAAAGRVVSVDPGRTFEPSDATGTDIEHPFDSREASYRTMEVAVDVTETWGESIPSDSVTVTVPIGSEVEPATAITALESLDRIVLVLHSQGFYGYAPDSWRIARNNALIGVIEDDGSLTFPALSETAEYFDQIETLDDFDRAASGPEQTVDLRSKV
ncbi:MAG: hypothetical protein ACRCYQ_00050, partial [Nocardioides sp.]